MTLNQALRRALILVAIFNVIQIVLQAPYLPAQMAVRFNAAGAPVGFSSAQAFSTINLVIIAIIVTAFLILPGAMTRRRQLRWRLPNRAYWLANERREQTVEYLQRQFMWFGIITLILLMAVFQLVVDANRHTPTVLDSTRLMWLLIGYFAFIAVWLWAFWRKFSRRPPDKSENPFG
ncbi:MAG TPA: hypothetical protein VKB41_10810 [Steroidobacteraceae bacterium]|jgi:uncharacterized membrane protein|nr:hypothetical protein [Steroidobacteraceae bacterium]